MADDAMKKLTDSLTETRKREDAEMSGEDRMKRQYAEWARDVAYPAIQRIVKTLKADGAHVEVVKPEGSNPTFGMAVVYPSSGQPGFTYLISLHDKTDPDRAFVMRSRTIANDHYPRSGKKTQSEKTGFYNEHEDGMTNHAPLITGDAIIEDFTKHFTAHREYSWPD